MNIHLVTFVTDKKFGVDNYYAESVKRLFDSAKKFGIEHFHLYNPRLLPVGTHTLKYMNETSEPGFGFYSWRSEEHRLNSSHMSESRMPSSA